MWMFERFEKSQKSNLKPWCWDYNWDSRRVSSLRFTAILASFKIQIAWSLKFWSSNSFRTHSLFLASGDSYKLHIFRVTSSLSPGPLRVFTSSCRMTLDRTLELVCVFEECFRLEYSKNIFRNLPTRWAFRQWTYTLFTIQCILYLQCSYKVRIYFAMLCESEFKFQTLKVSNWNHETHTTNRTAHRRGTFERFENILPNFLDQNLSPK